MHWISLPISAILLTVAVGSASRVKRVIGGIEFEEGKWPWLVSLQGKIPDFTIFGIPITYRKFYCGASLINDRWILTAAHCFKENDLGPGLVGLVYIKVNGIEQQLTDKVLRPNYWHARLGDIELSADLVDRLVGLVGDFFDISRLREWTLHGEKIVIHPEYNSENLWANDIALVKLEEDVPSGSELLSHIQSVHLPVQGLMTFPRDMQKCIMKGWGCTAGGGSVASVAREVELPKVSDLSCRQFWNVPATTRLCAGYNLQQKGICSGDSGGPLVCNTGDSWVQVGIASFTSANRPGNVPGVFTRVSQFTDWIQQVIMEDERNQQDES
ncbi:hypothetical protein CAPTEDRAFT_188642 [Capitella teleta]|uniref:Peptidase S1 domain-containing protein n=1 Tax=Capitella teleta TaxID=283909 RepID=R7UZW3_CAPTE|nr:hypothetical protein CAPTEDRAFT_188642 [Capitella teleta]|eukprot:ELU11834.1 hypothetical protein CAPTEDRAFT_188642 [Capitella teleta]